MSWWTTPGSQFLVSLVVFLVTFLRDYVEGEATLSGPRDVTTRAGATIFVECLVVGVADPPPVFWRLSGIEYSPSTLPARFVSNSTGLIIHPVTNEDDGLTVQCSITLVDTSVVPIIVTKVNSSIGVIDVVMDGDNASLLSLTTGSPGPTSHHISSSYMSKSVTSYVIPTNIVPLTTRPISGTMSTSRPLVQSSSLQEQVPLSNRDDLPSVNYYLLIPLVSVGVVLTSWILISICLVFLIVARKHKRKRTVYVESNQAYDIVELRRRGQPASNGHIVPPPLYPPPPPPPPPQVNVHIKTEVNVCYETVLLHQNEIR